MPKFITKKAALAEFRASTLPLIVQLFGKGDKPAQSEAWCNYVDRLHRSGKVSTKQVELVVFRGPTATTEYLDGTAKALAADFANRLSQLNLGDS